jgi:hypothetical protein
VKELTICTNVLNVIGSSIGNYSALHIALADIWWYCEKRNLCDILPSSWTGTCALVQLAIPFTLAFHQVPKQDKSNHQAQRAIAGSFDSNIYIDSIGVPRGFPSGFKTCNQIVIGFESALFCWSTIDKNVDWINCIYYDLQRFINKPRILFRG